jgi:hypothetical protein
MHPGNPNLIVVEEDPDFHFIKQLKRNKTLYANQYSSHPPPEDDRSAQVLLFQGEEWVPVFSISNSPGSSRMSLIAYMPSPWVVGVFFTAVPVSASLAIILHAHLFDVVCKPLQCRLILRLVKSRAMTRKLSSPGIAFARELSKLHPETLDALLVFPAEDRYASAMLRFLSFVCPLPLPIKTCDGRADFRERYVRPSAKFLPAQVIDSSRLQEKEYITRRIAEVQGQTKHGQQGQIEMLEDEKLFRKSIDLAVEPRTDQILDENTSNHLPGRRSRRFTTLTNIEELPSSGQSEEGEDGVRM